MSFGFHQKCKFCYEQKLEKAPPRPFDWLRRLMCIGTYFCPHCFDEFRRPTIPGLATVLFWLGGYVAIYAVVADPVELVAYEWPDDRALVNQQLIFAPLIKIDPRIHEARLDRNVYKRGVSQVAEENAGTVLR